MTCQVCGTVDNKDGRGPVLSKPFGEGLCNSCYWWYRQIKEFFEKGF